MIDKNTSDRISLSFRYDPDLVAKVKSIPGHKWHPAEKYWSFPNSDGTLKKILEAFEGEEIHPLTSQKCGINLDPASQDKLTAPVIARSETSSLSLRGTKSRGNLNNPPSPLAGEGQGEGYNFDGLRKELVSRKYSYRTIKGYLYYNRDFLSFIKKQPSDISDSDIKDYLCHLAEERQSATSTLNQAINALKFYYGSMLKRKFVYEIKRPRKDKNYLWS